MKRFLQLVSVVAILVCSSVAQQSNQSPIQAQVVVPRLIRFSGQLPGASGTVGITFTLHKGQQDNAALWIETQNVQLDSTGKYTVLLGVTKPEGIPTDLFSSGEAQWLGVQIQGKSEQPRVLLVSVPYALRAAEADTLAGHSPAEFVTTDKLTSAVQQQMQAASTSTTATPVHKDSAVRNSSPTMDAATDFTDTTTNQVVLVTQHGTGAGLIATAGNNYALSGTSTNTAVYGSSNGSSHATAAAMEGVTTASQGRGIFGWANTTTGVNFGLYGQANSVSGTGIAAVSTATSGSTVGMEIQTNSPAGTAAVVQARGGGKIISGQSGSTNTEKFAVDGSGNVTASGNVSATGDVIADGFVEAAGAVYGNYGYFDTTVPNFDALIAYSASNQSGTPTAYFSNNDNTDAGDLVFEALGPNFGGQCTIDVAGNLYCTGALSVVAMGSEGKKNSLYTMQSPENFLEDFGSVKLVNGVAKVSIDAALKGVISDETSYHVFLTPNGDCEGLYVTNRTATTFEVRELKGGKSNIDVDFRIVAHRAGFEHKRMPDVTKQMAIPAKLPMQAPVARPLQTAAVTSDSRN